jgi:hypothetical protein
MPWKIVPSQAFFDLQRDWQRLADQYHSGHPLLDSRFVAECLKSFGGDGTRLAIEESAAGLQSMLLLDNVGRWSATSFSPSQLPICPLVTSTQSLGDSLRELVKARAWSGLLGLMRYDSRYYGPISGAGIEHLAYATTMEVATQGTFEEYWAARHKKLRDNIGRYFRRAKAAGHDVRLVETSEAEEMTAAVTRYGELESRGWKGQAGSAIEIGNAQGEFYSNVVKSMANTGNAAALELWFNDVLVASRLLISANGIVVFLKTTYREDFSEFAAGRLLLHAAIEKLFANSQNRSIEFYTNASADQLQWATSSRALEHLNVYRSGAVARLVRLRRSWQARRAAR